MELQLFNSLFKRITKLELNPEQTINIYLCGPTVYDHIHVGNLRPIIIFDILYRLLLNLKFKVNYIQNITDIDDKIIAKAEKEKKSEKEISDYYSQSYFDNLINYNILFPTHSPRVTNYLPQIQSFITSSLKKKVAYQHNWEIFFRIGTNQEYGKLSGQNLAKLKSGIRELNQQSNKLDKKDFVLWKKTDKGVVWESPWGAGRPGWHTECAVFIQEKLAGKTLDIHGGGNDLLFPHHENERIQYLAHNNQELSKIWLHISHLHWAGEKMSKSIGNVLLAKDFAQKYGSEVFRYLVLNTHYNQVINLNEELIQQASQQVQKIKNLLKKLKFYCYTEKLKIGSKETQKKQVIINCLLNNLNTPKALFLLEETINSLNKSIDKGEKTENLLSMISDFYFLGEVLGFKFDLPTYSAEIELLIEKWQQLRKNGDYFRADKIRSELQKLNII